MIGNPQLAPAVEFSVQLYRMLLSAYPARFKREYGSAMVDVFRDCCLQAVRQSGRKGMWKLWFVTLLDLAQSVITEHTQKEAQMKREMKPEDIRRAGWALIGGGISFVLSIFLAIVNVRNWSPSALLLLVFVSLPLLVFGMWGLRNRYGERVGGLARNILLIGMILGPVTSLLGFLLSGNGELWILAWAGPAVLFLGLILFGIAALNAQPLPRWNMLPLLAGLSYPAIILFQIVSSFASGDWSRSSMPPVAMLILIILQGIALLSLGYILKSDVPEESAAMA